MSEETNTTKDDVVSNSMFETSVETSFFYTNDKFLNNVDNKDIFLQIQAKYKNLCPESSDAVIKKSILLLLEDDEFILKILDFYDMTIYEFFKLLYVLYGTMFKGQFLKKVRRGIENKLYVKRTRHLKLSGRTSKDI